MGNTILIKVKNPENCHKDGFSHIKKNSTRGLDYNRILVVNNDNEAIGFVLKPQITIVPSGEVIKSLEDGTLSVEKSLPTLKKQLKHAENCILCNLNPLARFGHNVGLTKPVRDTRYATNEESFNCEKELIRTLLCLGITGSELYSYSIRESLLESYCDVLFNEEKV